MIKAAIVGMGWWGRTLVESASSASRSINFVAGATQFTDMMRGHPLIADRVRRMAERRRAYLRGHADAKAMFADQAAHPFPVHVDG